METLPLLPLRPRSLSKSSSSTSKAQDRDGGLALPRQDQERCQFIADERSIDQARRDFVDTIDGVELEAQR
jgi:hypothetical protein